MTEPTGRARVRRRVRIRRRRRWLRWTLVLVGLLAVVGAVALIPALGARARLAEARASMEEGRRAALAGELEPAREAFAAAESAFIRAEGQAGNPVLRAVSLFPVVGRSPRTVGAMAEAGALVARAGRLTAGAVADLPDGLGSLAPRRGRIAVEPLREVAEPLARAEGLVERAREVFDAAPGDLLLGPVAEARHLFDRALTDARRVLRPAAALARALPAFLGADGRRTYFFGAQDPAELRGTGGLIGAYALVRADGGRLRFGPFAGVGTLGRAPPGAVEPPTPDFAARYAEFGALELWENANMTPDFPSAALALERLYRQRTGRSVDGAVVADPEALAALLEVTGPVEVPGTGDTITAENAVSYLSNEAFARLPDAAARKRLLGDAARVVFGRFLAGAGGADPVVAARTLTSVVADGHLLLHAADPAIQRDLERAGVAGRLPRGDADLLAVVANNAAGIKVDFYATREVSYTVELEEAGGGIGEATVRLGNEAPRRGQPPYVIGPFSEGFRPGENVTYVSTYCGRGCGLERFVRNGERDTVSIERELGHPVLASTIRVRSGKTASLRYRWSLADAWEGGDGRGTYELDLVGQPTIRPTRARIEVVVPEGMRVVATSEGMRPLGDRAVWEGVPSDLLRFRVEFSRPLVPRLWRSVTRFLTRPLIRL